MAEERENLGGDERSQDEGVARGTEGGLGTGGESTDAELGSDTDTGGGLDTGMGSDTNIGESSGELWTDPGSEDITRHSGP